MQKNNMMLIKKKCLFCENENVCNEAGNPEKLYSQNFKENDLNPDVFSARRSTDHFHYNMKHCRKTGLVFSSDVLPDPVLLDLYQNSRFSYQEFTGLLCQNYWNPIKTFNHFFTKENALEIGCGNGFFIEKLMGIGFKNVYGCEPCKQAIDIAKPEIKEKILCNFFKKGLFDKNYFDFICSFHTLDHVSDPSDFLNTCFEILKPKGFAYFITHNVNSIQAILLGEKSPIIDIEHIYLFNKQTLQMIGEKAGFRTFKNFNIRNSYPITYWLRMSPVPFKKIILKIASSLRLSNRIIAFKAGNIGILFQKL